MNAIRLAGGQNRFEGRVELCHNGQWKRVCIYGWFGEEANVACRQLGFSGSLTRKISVSKIIQQLMIIIIDIIHARTVYQKLFRKDTLLHLVKDLESL